MSDLGLLKIVYRHGDVESAACLKPLVKGAYARAGLIESLGDSTLAPIGISMYFPYDVINPSYDKYIHPLYWCKREAVKITGLEP